MKRDEVVLSLRAVVQPSPVISPGGDCSACVLGGFLGLSVPEVYEGLLGGKIEPLSWTGMRQALWDASSKGMVDRLIDDVPIWPAYDPQAIWGAPSWGQNMEWFHRMRMAIDGGYYGFCSIDYAAKGPFVDGDHWVLVCGAREVPRPHPTVAKSHVIHQEILVSCSASGISGTWHDARTFLKHRGGFNVLLARPCSSS